MPVECLLDKLIAPFPAGAMHAEQVGPHPVMQQHQPAHPAPHPRQLAQVGRAHVLLAEGAVARLIVGHLHLVLLHNVVPHCGKVEGDILVADLAPNGRQFID